MLPSIVMLCPQQKDTRHYSILKLTFTFFFFFARVPLGFLVADDGIMVTLLWERALLNTNTWVSLQKPDDPKVCVQYAFRLCSSPLRFVFKREKTPQNINSFRSHFTVNTVCAAIAFLKLEVGLGFVLV